MFLTSEIHLTKKYVSKDEWLELIKTISGYNGIFRKWKIIIKNDKTRIRYFVMTKCSLPATINNLNSFLLKNICSISMPNSNSALPFVPMIGSNIIDLINYFEIRRKGNLEFLEITFQKLYDDKIRAKIKFYLNKNGCIKTYRLMLTSPTNLLSIDFEGNKRYYYKSAPKYLDINKVLRLLNSDENSAVLKIDTFPYLRGNFYLNQNSYSFYKHSIAIGSSGCGKSKFISLLIDNINKNNNLKQKYKIVVFDPHASLERDIGGISKVIDFKSKLDSTDLFINNCSDIISSTELLLELLKSLIADQYNSKLERVLRHSIHILLTDEAFTLVI